MNSVNLISTLAIVVLMASVNANGQAVPIGQSTDVYDAQLADELGADEYGMRAYVFVVLKTGPANITDEARRNEIFAGHFSNIARLSEEGKLVLAGPFIEGGEKRGMYIFKSATIEEAKAIVQSDPAVAAGIFTPEFTRFYGSAALIKIYELHKTIQKTKIG